MLEAIQTGALFIVLMFALIVIRGSFRDYISYMREATKKDKAIDWMERKVDALKLDMIKRDMAANQLIANTELPLVKRIHETEMALTNLRSATATERESAKYELVELKNRIILSEANIRNLDELRAVVKDGALQLDADSSAKLNDMIERLEKVEGLSEAHANEFAHYHDLRKRTHAQLLQQVQEIVSGERRQVAGRIAGGASDEEIALAELGHNRLRPRPRPRAPLRP